MLWKDPHAYERYRNSDSILCQINGECRSSRTRRFGARDVQVAEGRDRMLLLRNFYTFFSLSDEIISPPETARFDFFKPGELAVSPFEESELFSEDRIGLRALLEAGRWHRVELRGYKHRDFIVGRVEEFYAQCLRWFFMGRIAEALYNCSLIDADPKILTRANTL